MAKNNLFPVFNVPSVLAESAGTQQEKYAPAPLFDVKTGEFVMNGAKQTLYGSGYDAYCQEVILIDSRFFG